MASNTPYEPVANPALGDRPHSPGVALDHYPDVDVQPRFLGPEARSAGGPYTRESYISTHSGYASQHTTGSTPYFEPYSDLPGGESTADLYQGGGTGSQSYGQSYGASTAEKYPPTSFPSTAARKSKSKWIGITLAAIVVIAAGAGLGVYFAVIRPKHTGAAGSSPDSNHTSGNAPHSGSNSLGTMLGKDGSLVVTSDGSSFTYKNSFGGYWVLDQSTPFNDGARPQSWSPALNDTFDYGGVDKIRGVNLGGWLNLEPFITPALYQKYSSNPTPPHDEWTLHQAMAADTAGGGLQKIMEQHYSTFITEEDFAQIAGAGLNYVRIPLPYWVIETAPGEPFLPKVGWKYFLKAIEWARKYGIRINLDLHAVSGSQNAYNHSGKQGQINFLNGVMGLANVQRTLDHIRILAEFICQPQYANVVTMFSILNEPILKTIGEDNMKAFYFRVHEMIRDISGRGQGKGPWIAVHDGFNGISNWAGFMPGSDRLALDTHTYFCFGGVDQSPLASQASKPCKAWGGGLNDSMAAFGFTVAGEFSNGFNDCGLFLNGVSAGTRWEGTLGGGSGPGAGPCSEWTEWEKWDAGRKKDLMNFALSSMDALGNWFFWTWKIGNSTAGHVEAPLWSYQLGLQNGWMPLDPRTSTGVCAALSAASPFVGKLKPSQTGGVGAGTIDPAFSSRYGVWPPASINSGGAASLLPAYTPTGTLSTLPVPTFTQLIVASATATVTASFSSVDPGNGWFAKGDAAKAYVPIAGCTYPDNWDALTAQIPGAQCVAGATAPATVPDAATPATPAATDPAAAVTPAPGPAAPSPATKRMHVVEARVTLMA